MFDWLLKLFKKKPEPKAAPEEQQGGGTTVSLERVLQRLDPSKDLPSAVRIQAIKTLTAISGREIHMAAQLGNLKLAKKISTTLQSVENDFPGVLERMSREEKTTWANQRDRATVRVARLEGSLRGSDGNASNYGAKPNAKTEERRKKLQGGK